MSRGRQRTEWERVHRGSMRDSLGEDRCSIFTNNISFTLSKLKSCTSKMYLSSMSCVDEYIFLLGKETV